MSAKRSSCAALLLALLVVASISWLGGSARNSQAAPAPPTEADFAGKIVFILTDQPYGDRAGAILEQVQLRKIGGRSFLVGKGVDGGQPSAHAYKGQIVWFSVDHIVQIVEFANMDELKKKAPQMFPPPPPIPRPAPSAKRG
jgi:hypothetical protein